jgi:hypothetical protein
MGLAFQYRNKTICEGPLGQCAVVVEVQKYLLILQLLGPPPLTDDRVRVSHLSAAGRSELSPSSLSFDDRSLRSVSAK